MTDEEIKEIEQVYIICPVRNASLAQNKTIRNHVERNENKGYKVYWPSRDTKQKSPDGGYSICVENRNAIIRADLILVYWDPKSAGSLFDLGMAFALNKPIKVLNSLRPQGEKSFEQVMVKWSRL